MKKYFLGISLVLLAVVLLVFFLAELPYSVRGKGVVGPLKEWGLYTASDGTLMNKLQDNASGGLKEYRVMEFQRGDVVSFFFNDRLETSKVVSRGDTIAWLISNDLRMRLVETRGELAHQESLLQVYLTGEKPEAVQKALDEVELARQELITQERITERISHLYEQDLVSTQEYELALNDLEVRRYALEIALSNYETIIAGEKEEEIGAVRARIESLEKQVEQLQKHIDDMNILSPISGSILRKRNLEHTENEEVIRVADLSSLLVFVPVDVHETEYIHPGQEVIISSLNKKINASVHSIDNSVQLINNRPRIFVSVVIDNSDETGLIPNMVVDAKIITQTVSVKEYISRISRVAYQN